MRRIRRNSLPRLGGLLHVSRRNGDVSVPERAIRFGVRAVSGYRAATWKVWTEDGPDHDVYLACRELKGELKASLHQSGKWHIAFSKKFYEEGFADQLNRPDSRFSDAWPRPTEIGPGVTLAFRVVVPWFSATVKGAEEEAGVVWIHPAPEGQAIEFAILLTSPTCVISGWPAKRSMNSQLVSSFPLSSGETVWVVYTTMTVQMPPPKRGQARFFKGAQPSALQSPGLRAILFGEEPDGSRVLYDVPIVAE
jgi:hypothetical protein